MEAKTKEINGKNYQVAPFMAIEALKLKTHFVKLLAPSIGELVGNGENVLDTELNSSNIGKMIAKLGDVLDENNFIALVKRLLQNVVVNWTNENGEKKAIAFATDFETSLNLCFQGELFSLYPVILFVLEVNYPDFFQKISSLIGPRMQATPISAKGDIRPKKG